MSASEPVELDGPVMSDRKHVPSIYHTHECVHLPDEVRPLTEDDRRRSIRKCSECRAMEESDGRF